MMKKVIFSLFWIFLFSNFALENTMGQIPLPVKDANPECDSTLCGVVIVERSVVRLYPVNEVNLKSDSTASDYGDLYQLTQNIYKSFLLYTTRPNASGKLYTRRRYPAVYHSDTGAPFFS